MRPRTVIITIVVLLVIIIGVVVAVTATNTHKTTTMTNSDMGDMDMSKAVATDAVSIKDFAFGPNLITVKAGTTVTWTNHDAVRHSVTSDDGSAMQFDSGLLATDATYTMTFTKAGTYHYHCTPHPYMKAAVIVTD